MLVAVADPAVSRERIEQDFVRAPIEGRKLEPLFQRAEHLIGLAGKAAHQVLQDSDVGGAKPAALREQPAVEMRAAIDLQALQEVAGEQRGKPSQLLGGQLLDPIQHGAGDREDIDEAVAQVERHRVVTGLDPSPARLVENAPELAQGPAKLASRIVRNIPQKFAEVAAPDGMRRQRQVGDEGSHFARRREWHRDTAPADR